MKILLTGASSFTGLWFAEALAAKGHEVVATLYRKFDDYQGLKNLRVQRLKNYAECVEECAFGSDSFMKMLETHGPFDMFCHHAAEVTDYKSEDFDFLAALSRNTHHLKKVLQTLKAQNCQKILLSGSLFEQNEGFSSDSPHAISPYGLSKGLTSDVFLYFSTLYGLSLGKFVIPNPFGPFEEARFTTYLASCWLENKIATVTFPNYVRDNIPVSLLAKGYAHFAENLSEKPGFTKFNPSFCPAPQSFFVQQFAQEMKNRLNSPCEFTLLKQSEFLEPKVRINSERLDPSVLEWDEASAWDALAKFYLQTLHKSGS